MTSEQKRRLKGLARRLFGAVFSRTARQYPPELLTNSKRILVVNGAHAGDVVMSTAVLGALRSAYPLAEIGFVAGSWSRMVVAGHPNVAFVHVVDHWKMNRSNRSFASKFGTYLRTRRQALKEIRALGYDVSICLHAYYSDLLSLCWQAGIPVRAAFDHSVAAPLANITASYPENPLVQQRQCFSQLLGAMSLDDSDLAQCRAELAADTPQSISEVCDLLNVSNVESLRYVVVHIGSGAPARELPVETWRKVVRELSAEHLVILTGRGAREKRAILQVIGGLPNCVDASDRLSWQGFVTTIRHADRMYGVESMAGHVAAAVGTPSVLAYSGMAGVARWRPDTDLATIWTHHVPCSPCGNMRGCDHMACVREIRGEDLVSTISIGTRT